MLHEGNEAQGKYGKQGWSIARRCIAVAMDQGGSIKIAYRDVAVRRPGGRAPTVGALRRRQEQLAGSSQIFPDFVQVQTVFYVFQGIRTLLFEFTDEDHKLSPPSCNMRANPAVATVISAMGPTATLVI